MNSYRVRTLFFFRYITSEDVMQVKKRQSGMWGPLSWLTDIDRAYVLLSFCLARKASGCPRKPREELDLFFYRLQGTGQMVVNFPLECKLWQRNMFVKRRRTVRMCVATPFSSCAWDHGTATCSSEATNGPFRCESHPWTVLEMLAEAVINFSALSLRKIAKMSDKDSRW